MKWFRYKHKWAHGIDREWEYIELGDGDYRLYFADDSEHSEEDYIEDMGICKDGNWSDKYRGIDYDVVDTIPRELLEKKIENARAASERWANTAERYQKELDHQKEVCPTCGGKGSVLASMETEMCGQCSGAGTV